MKLEMEMEDSNRSSIQLKDYRSTLTYISKQTTNDHRHAHHDQSQQFCAVLNVANSRRQLEASQSAGSGCNDRPVESDGKRLDSELNDDKDQRAAYSGQISGEIVSSRWCSDKQTSDRIQMAEQIHEESPSDAVSEQEQAELLGAQMLQEALQMLESRKELAESVASLPASSKQVEQTQADEQLESTIEGASRKELAKEAEVAEDRRSLNTEELSSLFDYADELQTAKHLELNKSDSAVDVDQLLFIRSQGLSMSSPTSVRSPNSPTNTSLTDSSSSSLIVGRLGEQAQSEECPQQQENSVKDDQKQEKDQNGEPWAPNGQFGEPETVAGEDKSCTNGHDEVDEDFCGAQQASEVKLRQLRMSTLEDVSVCGQNRHSAEAARRLFDSLCRSQKGQQAANGNTARGRDRHSATRRRNRGVSLDGSSGNSELGEEELRSSLSSNQEEMNGPSLDQSHGSFRASVIDIGIGAEDNDCGYIKLVRRCGSSAGASSSSGNYGRTLVCSVSPTGQQHQQVFPAASPVAFDGSQLSSSTEDRQEGMGVSINGDDLSLYPIDGDEIRQCRAAFRENRRLIEKAARLASSCDRQSSANFDGSTWSAGMMQANGRHPEGSMGSNRSRWANTLQRIRPLPHCTRCQQRLYPVDKLELDFTKTTLNIHRNCFRCQVCSSMLRLETYAAIDSKLYCPAHTKCVTTNR